MQNSKSTSRVALQGDVAKDKSGPFAVFTGFVCVTNDGRKSSWTLLPDNQDAQDKRAMQYHLTPRSIKVDAPTLLEISKSECPNIWVRSATTHMAKRMAEH